MTSPAGSTTSQARALPLDGSSVGDTATYFGELYRNRRPLLAASLGVAVSLSLLSYTNSVFAPFLLKEFGWSRSQFSLIGVAILATLVFLPVIGRLTDRLGVRRMALTGTLLMPLCFVGLSSMNGSFGLFVVLDTLLVICGTMTSQLVYTRLIAENFTRAGGFALTLVNCTPAALAIAVVPTINFIIEAVGWRPAYLILGGFCLAVGCIALALVPPRKPEPASSLEKAAGRSSRADFRLICRSRVLWIVLSAMFLCLLQTPIHTSQMNIMLLDQSLTPAAAARIVSIYAFGTIVGRFCCGFALDRYSTRIVSFISMALPAGGFLLLATDVDAPAAILAAMFLVGLSVGAESDLISFLISKYFKIQIFSSTLSLLFCCSYLASATGSLILSITLHAYDSFSAFLYFIAAATLAGGAIFLLLPKSEGFEKIG